jgi:hypothetical protein
VQKGKERVRAAVESLSKVAGPSYPVLFLKMGIEEWTPVGEEELFSIVDGKEGTAAVVLCDSEGNTKAMSGWVSRSEAAKFAKELETSGHAGYGGQVRLPL